MLPLAIAASLLAIKAACGAPSQRDTSSSLVVKTSSGILYGSVNASVPNVRQWLAVPFAQPPIGDLRWLPPTALPANSSSRSLEVKTFGLNCPQFEGTAKNVYTQNVRELLISGPTGEDCLTLSIWAPQYPTGSSLPVLIWLYGGAFQTGGSSVPYQNPAKWVQRTQSHIVVSVQYRLNIFGFPGAEGLQDQNLGLLDQRAGIEWLQKNIAAFGGNPDQMVLWGQSAGAWSTVYQQYAFPSNPVVKGFIADSGNALSTFYPRGNSLASFKLAATKLGCNATDAQTRLQCMRQIPEKDIVAFLQYYSDTNETQPIGFYPIVDNKVIFANYTARLLNGSVAKIPAIFGTNAEEGTSLVPYPSKPQTQAPDPAAVLTTTRSIFTCGSVIESTYRDRLGLLTYRYLYNGNFSNISPLYWMGAYHSSELPLIFGTYNDARGQGTQFEIDTSEKMQDFYLAFAKNPQSGLDQLGWYPHSKGVLEYLGGAYNGTGQAIPAQRINATTYEAPCLTPQAYAAINSAFPTV